LKAILNDKQAIQDTIDKYNIILSRIDNDIDTVNKFKSDLIVAYAKNDLTLNEMLQVQTAIMRQLEYITQKENNKVELLRQLDEFKNELD
jgi:hypothetical protein